MAYVYISDITPAAETTAVAPVAPTVATAAALESNAKTLELTAQAVVNPQVAVGLQAQAAVMRKQAEQIRSELTGLSTGTKVGIGAAILAAVYGTYCWTQRSGRGR